MAKGPKAGLYRNVQSTFYLPLTLHTCFEIYLFTRWEFQHAFNLKSFIDSPARDIDILRMKNNEIGLFRDGKKEFFDAFDP